MNYVFEILNDNNRVLDDAVIFVKTHEYRCVNLAEQLRLHVCHTFGCGGMQPARNRAGQQSCTDGTSGSIVHAAVLYRCGQKRECNGVLLLNKSGILFHCVDEMLALPVLTAFTAFFFSDAALYRRIYAIAGSEQYTVFLEHFIEKAQRLPVIAVKNYYLMRCMTQCSCSFLPEAARRCNTALTVIEAGEKDTEALFPLQLAYEQAEVSFAGMEINPDVCRLALRARLRKYLTYTVSAHSVLVAKAGLNAEGFNWVQLGGVYTAPEYRNRGIAAALTAAVIQKCLPARHGIALFVKKNNTAALRVYTKLGFSFCGSFRMCYYQKKK